MQDNAAVVPGREELLNNLVVGAEQGYVPITSGGGVQRDTGVVQDGMPQALDDEGPNRWGTHRAHWPARAEGSVPPERCTRRSGR